MEIIVKSPIIIKEHPQHFKSYSIFFVLSNPLLYIFASFQNKQPNVEAVFLDWHRCPFWRPWPQSCSRDLQQCRMASKPLGVLPRGVFRLPRGICPVVVFCCISVAGFYHMPPKNGQKWPLNWPKVVPKKSSQSSMKRIFCFFWIWASQRIEVACAQSFRSICSQHLATDSHRHA